MAQEISSRSAAEPVEVGFIGAGNVLWAYLQVLDRLVPRGLAVEGLICGRRKETWPGILAGRPAARLVDDPIDVVESADVVVVITAADSHGDLARLALDHQKHVLVEKPFATHLELGEELVELARNADRYLVVAPFVTLSPTFRALWTELDDGAIGAVHSARGLYGIAAPDWNTWMYRNGPLPDLGIYNLKSLTGILGPATELVAFNGGAHSGPTEHDFEVGPDSVHLVLRHEGGALSSVVAAWDIHQYRRCGLELYGTTGTANLLGDDWDPRGYEIWRTATGTWEQHSSMDPTWLWADGLRELVAAVVEERPPRQDLAHDLHLLDILRAARRSADSGLPETVSSRFGKLDLHWKPDEGTRRHLHDHTRSPAEQ